MKIAALEQTLRDHPDDGASWLVYGDLLLERGDARGKLIRLEQRRVRTRPGDRDALDRQIAALVRRHRKSWDSTLPPGATVLSRRYGFATKIAVEWSDSAPVFIEQALRAAPFVTALRIAPPADEAVDSDEDYWDSLDDFDRADDSEPAPSVETGALATLDLSRLVELDLSYLRIGALGAQTLAVSTYLRVEASDTGVGPEAGSVAAAVAASTATRRVAELDLRYCRVGDTGLAALAASPTFNGARRLHLQRNALTVEGMRALHGFADLTELDLRYNAIGAEGVEALLAAPFIGSLKRLLLYRADASDVGAKMLATAPQLPPALRSFWRSFA
jgi:uncharacterized protein (TIGR02996 family)